MAVAEGNLHFIDDRCKSDDDVKLSIISIPLRYVLTSNDYYAVYISYYILPL